MKTRKFVASERDTHHLSPAMATASSLPRGSGNERFNAEAAAWDSNPLVHQASEAAFDAIRERFPALQISDAGGAAAKDGLDVLEIGCGTGLLSLLMAPHVRLIVAVDAAPGMIDALAAKLAKPDAPKNVRPICVLLEDPEDRILPPAFQDDHGGPRLKYDLILSHLVLHHIADLEGVLRTMLACLKKGAGVALTDFEDFGPEARRFHPKGRMEGVERHGINREWMVGLMEKVGFVDVRVEVGWKMAKSVERFEGEFGEIGSAEDGQGEVMEFPFLVCVGRKPC